MIHLNVLKRNNHYLVNRYSIYMVSTTIICIIILVNLHGFWGKIAWNREVLFVQKNKSWKLILVVKTKLIQTGMRIDGNAKPFTLQQTNVRRNLNSAQNHIQNGSTRVVQVMVLIIQTTFARTIPVLVHLIVFRYRKRNIIVFAIRDIERMKIINAKKLSM